MDHGRLHGWLVLVRRAAEPPKSRPMDRAVGCARGAGTVYTGVQLRSRYEIDLSLPLTAGLHLYLARDAVSELHYPIGPKGCAPSE